MIMARWPQRGYAQRMTAETALTCAHEWRRGPMVDALGRFGVQVCVRCGQPDMLDPRESWPELSADEAAHVLALRPPVSPAPALPRRTRLRYWVQEQRTRLASVVAGYDVTDY